MNASLILFAQQQKFDAKRPPANPEEVMAVLAANVLVVIGILLCVLIVHLAITVPFCMSMSKALNRCSERNRQMSPGLVWLFIIPCLQVIWLFFIVIWVPASLQKEYEDRGMDDRSNYGKTMGLTSAILWAVSVVLNCAVGWIPFVAICPTTIALVGFVMWIVFWVQVAGYSSKLASGE